MSGKILKTGCLAAELGKPENVIAIVNAVEEGIGNDPGAAQAIADAIADKLPIASTEQKGIVELATNAEAVAGTSTTLAVTPAGLKAAIDGAALPAAALPAATDTIQGKVALNLGASLPGDATNTTDALTAFGFNALASSTATAGGNALQKAIVDAVQQAIGGDTGAQQALADAIADNLASAAGFAASVKAAETKTTLAVSGVNYVYTNEAGVATVLQPGQFLSSDAGNALAVDAQGRIKVSIPALAAALSTAMPDAFDA